jgi:hypothetical protein
MTLSAEQYMALSAVAYTNLTEDDEGRLLKDIDFKDENLLQFSALSSLLDWTLISYQPNTASGFAGMAFQNPLTGEIVFAFRGTEPFAQFGADVTNADIQIALQNSIDGLPAQFTDAEAFVSSA